jgi:hypothetical protein
MYKVELTARFEIAKWIRFGHPARLRKRLARLKPVSFDSAVMGTLEKDDPYSAMPDFASVGLQHVYPRGGASNAVLQADFEALLDYLEAIEE